ncbi:MAG: response regulator transcription factor [Nocardioidaceae bacterium]
MDSEPASIMVVDDSEVIRSLIVLNLELEGFATSVAKDGQECLDLVETVRPDLITLDVAMPRLDGFSTVARLRANRATSSIPIVMITARAQGADLERGADLGVDAYITKPFEPDQLVDTIRGLLAQERDDTPG